ncbi:hypothetical protein D9758_016792 [Tetrapyrgos nigripes]|uniref:Uncharacterized protein n=1 Tax=Tetrapyrgos nigripes TaxID=182062 RepID=A0A8H5BHI8_9AGAR|nr:hypothetical protein D9758_016792 [Tetrapyrgos nigripes]
MQTDRQTGGSVDFRSDSSSVLTKNSYYGPSQNDKLPVVAEMLDPEDAAWGPPHAHSSSYRPRDSLSSSTTSTSRWWSQKWQSRTRQGSDSSSSSNSSPRSSRSNSSQGWAQDFDPEDQAWTRRK